MPGPAPKDPSTRARRNADPIPTTVLTFIPGVQPELPARTFTEDVDGVRVTREAAWPVRTVAWWEMWGESAIAERFTASDWEFLLDTAMIHAAFWDGDLKQGAELRQRVAKFGATPEDRAKLRIQYAAADEADERVGRVRKVAPQPTSSNDPRNHLRAVN
jgi:hypothetical protein